MKRLIGVVFFLLSPVVFAQNGSVYAGGKFGFGHMEIGTERERSFGLKGFAGYRFPAGWMLEAGYSIQSSDDIFGAGDTFDLSRLDLMLGYQFELGDVLRIIPRIGRASWELKARDGSLVDVSGDQQSSREIGDGYDDIAELVFAFQLGERVQLDVFHEKAEYRFGETEISGIGVRSEF